jgi:hypothetical protein
VGRVIFGELGDTGDGPTIKVIEAPGNCSANGNCSVGLRVPVTRSPTARSRAVPQGLAQLARSWSG